MGSEQAPVSFFCPYKPHTHTHTQQPERRCQRLKLVPLYLLAPSSGSGLECGTKPKALPATDEGCAISLQPPPEKILDAHHMPGTVLGSRHLTVSKTKALSSRSL